MNPQVKPTPQPQNPSGAQSSRPASPPVQPQAPAGAVQTPVAKPAAAPPSRQPATQAPPQALPQPPALPTFKPRRTSSISTLLFIVIAIVLLVYLRDRFPSSKVQELKRSLQLATRSAPQRLWDFFRLTEDRTEVIDQLVLAKLQQKKIVTKAEELEALGHALPQLRERWLRARRSYMASSIRNAVEGCTSKSDPSNLLTAEPYFPSDWEFRLRTIIDPVQQAFADPQGDYVPGRKILAEFAQLESEIEGAATEFREGSQSMVDLIRKVREGSYCVANE
jgi:hypothetical protein